ncbi:MAG: DUF2164 domain-containing protein [Methanomicrobiales archaeon HGW-Methanomicrobiales-3]|jgi:uncharacterized protein (DUF2164 family)|nr:MAG: DUF2164 domain-containing protein [Methanomicrobiales archaeon HGW-Methanomicrobiales-3]
MKKKNSVVLTKERRDEMISEVRNYFSAEREEEIGDLAAGLILDFIIEKLAPEFYNQAVYDSHQFMRDATEDLLALRK